MGLLGKKPTWGVGRTLKKLVNTRKASKSLACGSWFRTFSSDLPKSQVGLLRRLTHRKCGLLLSQNTFNHRKSCMPSRQMIGIDILA